VLPLWCLVGSDLEGTMLESEDAVCSRTMLIRPERALYGLSVVKMSKIVD
jgi:hypothetical protein